MTITKEQLFDKFEKVLDPMDTLNIDITVGELLYIGSLLVKDLKKEFNIPEWNDEIMNVEVEKLKKIENPTVKDMSVIMKVCVLFNINRKLVGYTAAKVSEHMVDSIKEQVKEKENDEAHA